MFKDSSKAQLPAEDTSSVHASEPAPEDPRFASLHKLAIELDAALIKSHDVIDNIGKTFEYTTDARAGLSAAWANDSAIEKLYESAARNLTAEIVKCIVTRFDEPGLRMEFSFEDLLQKHKDAMSDIDWDLRKSMTPRQHWQGLTPSSALAAFREIYKPEVWRANQCKDAANTIVRAFGLFHDYTPRTVSGRVELSMRIRPETVYGHPRLRRFPYGELSGIAELEMMSEQSGYEKAIEFAVQARRILRSRQSSHYSSRERVEVCSNAHFVLFHEEVKFYLAPELFELILMFVSEHADKKVLDRTNRYF